MLWRREGSAEGRGREGVLWGREGSAEGRGREGVLWGREERWRPALGDTTKPISVDEALE